MCCGTPRPRCRQAALFFVVVGGRAWVCTITSRTRWLPLLTRRPLLYRSADVSPAIAPSPLPLAAAAEGQVGLLPALGHRV